MTLDRIIHGVKLFAVSAMLVALITLAFISLVGCHASAIDAQIKNAQNQSKLDAAKQKAKGQLDDAKGKAAPVSHPIAATQATVKEYHAPLLVISLVSGVLFAACVGLLFTPLSVVTKVAVWPLAAVSVLSFFELIALPFMPWVLGAVAVAAIGFFIYEWVRLKSPLAALKQIESDIGFNSSTAGTTATAAISSVTKTATSGIAALASSLHVATPKGMT